MTSKKFILCLIEHRLFGPVFQAFLVEKKESFYSSYKVVKNNDLINLQLNEEEINLVKLTEKYCDENLFRKFSKGESNRDFFQDIKDDIFNNFIRPYIDLNMNKIIDIIMRGNTPLFSNSTKYSNIYDEDRINISPEYASCIFYFDKRKEGTYYHLRLQHEKELLRIKNQKIVLVSDKPCTLLINHHLITFKKLNYNKLNPFLKKDFVFIPSNFENKYYKTFILNTIKEGDVKSTGFRIFYINPYGQAILSLEYDLNQKIYFFLKFRYNNIDIIPGNPDNNIVTLKKEPGNYTFQKINRDLEWEKSMIDKLNMFGLYENNGFYRLKNIELINDEDNTYVTITWTEKHKDELKQAGFSIQQNPGIKQFSFDKASIKIQTKFDNDWFDMHANISIGNFKIPFIKLKKYILNDIREFELPDGKIAILPQEWFSEYKEIMAASHIIGNKIKIRKHHFSLLKNHPEIIGKELLLSLEGKDDSENKKVTIPSMLKANMRSYQKTGFVWMYHLCKNHFGGCLADDMGLGKTLETLTLLLKMKQEPIPENLVPMNIAKNKTEQLSFSFKEKNSETEKKQPPSLIIMPTSLIHNWENEIKKFSPSLNVYKHIGNQRKIEGKLETAIQNFDIILTTYGTVRNDIDTLKEYRFLFLILDESQNIKNPSSKNYHSICMLSSLYRMVLTGTPIENSLTDLWSQMNFLNKGLLGSLSFFNREFKTPIEKKNDPEKQKKLQLLIHPFILRRTKEQVAQDLPLLTEQIRYCPMSEIQKKLYDEEKSAIRKEILKNIEKEGINKSAIVILQGLTKLRQLANHPGLTSKDEESDSGKFSEIMDNLKSLISENHKILVFSSFVKHLELIEKEIIHQKWRYSKLTGATIHREEEIRKFQEDPETRIFLISLKAGGTGLNLTAADYVFIIDPWWNPAAENQAIDRAHRIGQDKKVFVYRYITEGSIEEKIQILQEEKSSLANKFINSNNPFKKITEKEIMNFFE
ncbi:MAG: DEAD/DEAH box helicase [Prolixibacteraceae bacterium]|nr:DEAD/DEAH box helicase [Prolixibacteraceae bacterium]